MIRDPAKPIHPLLLDLDAGERQAIQMALEVGADTILMDDGEGRAAAKALNLHAQGTLGVLERSARLGLCDFRLSLAKLEQTTFRLTPKTRYIFLRRNP